MRTNEGSMFDSHPFLKWLEGPNGGGSTARPYACLGWAWGLPDTAGEEFWHVVTTAWSGFDRIPHRAFEEQFTRFADSRPPCTVPQRMTVYRGQGELSILGLSWTLDRTVAERFARGHRGINSIRPYVFEMEVMRDQVAFRCDDREEQEIVLRQLPKGYERYPFELPEGLRGTAYNPPSP
jgi:hypothetical protein